MALLSLIEFLLGIGLIIAVLHDVFQSVVLPRWTSRRYRFAPYFSDFTWQLWKYIGKNKTDVEAREDFMGAYAPFALMALLVMWVGLSILGYGLCFWALRHLESPSPKNFFEALYIAGETLLTIGFGEFTPTGAPTRCLAIAAGASGLAIFALAISFLFTLYGSFERREILVLTLDARAGSPASGVALLENYAELDLTDTLPDFFDKWEEWCAQVLHSHIAYPILPFFRSSHQGESWVAALGAVLDAATLMMTTICQGSKCGGKPLGAAHVMYRIGCHTVIDLSHSFGIRLDEVENPQPGVEKGEFLAARRRLQKAGYTLTDETESWEKFRRKRAVYAASLNELAKHFAAPPAQWIGDRSMIALSHHRAPASTPTTSLVPQASLFGGEERVS